MEEYVLLTISDRAVATGFSRVMESIIRFLPKHYIIHSLAINYRGDPYDGRGLLYPASLGGDLYGIKRLKNMVEKINPDAILILQDSWIIKHYLEQIPEHLDKVTLYIPVDAGPYLSSWVKDFPKCKNVVAYTRFGKSVLEAANPQIDAKIIPHGIDTSKFHPVDIKEARSRFSTLNDDMFIVLNVNRNQPRKRIDIALAGFSLFAQDKPNARYYHHAGLKDAGWDVIELSKRFGINNKLIITNKDISPTRYVSDEVLNLIYNAADVGINTSMGEGWGLCVASGTQIFTENGIEAIENIEKNGKVYDIRGKLRRVKTTYKRRFKGRLVSIKASGFAHHMRFTNEHPILTREGYKKASEIVVGDYIYRPELSIADKVESFDLSEYTDAPASKDLIYILTRHKSGQYVSSRKELENVRILFNSNLTKKAAKGYIRHIPADENLAVILANLLSGNSLPSKTIFPHKTDELVKVLENTFNYIDSRKRATLPEEIYSALRKLAFSHEIYLRLDYNSLLKFLEVLISLQSYEHPKNQRLLLSARNEDKIKVITTVLHRLGVRYSQFFIAGDGTHYFSLNKTDIEQVYENNTKTGIVRSYRNRKRDLGGCYYKVIEADSDEYNGYVYNLEVEKSHTYLVNGYVVHNCNMEHAITGRPQLIPNSSANKELYENDRGVFLDIDHYDINHEILTAGAVVSPRDVAEKLDFLYKHPEVRHDIGDKARRYFLRSEFKWENISARFRELLES
jgi:glycosyltransferase involved in cell wall biosynthesis